MKFTAQLFLTLIMLFSANAVVASNISAINSSSCKKIMGIKSPFILVLKKGQDVSKSILQCINDAGFKAVSFTGLGALKNPTLAYFNSQTKKYQNKFFLGTFELVALNGNVSELKNKRVTHIHVVLSNDQYKAMGGHLMHALVGPTAEITVIPLQGKLIRRVNKKTGLTLLGS